MWWRSILFQRWTNKIELKTNASFMNDKIATAVEWMAAGRKVALATVIGTWGSSPRPVGSQLVVDEDGNFEGSVSGGCIESTIITEAQHVIRQEKTQLLSLGIDNDQAWDTGLPCGGNIEIYVEAAEVHRPVLEQLLAFCKKRLNACLVTDLIQGTKKVISSEDTSADLPPALRKAVEQTLSTGRTICHAGGGRRLLLQGFGPGLQLVIIGAVHIAQPLARMARLAGYDTLIVDPRKAFATSERFPDTELITRRPEKAFEQISVHANTAIVVLCHSPQLDDPALIRALDSDAFYIGALGSRKTHAARLDRLKKAGCKKTDLERIHGPIGISIGSVTPAEIALSIMAEITRVKRNS